MSTYEIKLAAEAQSELAELRPYDASRILAAIDASLVHEPTTRSRNRKPLSPTPAELGELLPRLFPQGVAEVWQLRVGTWRVTYLVEAATVWILRIVDKGRKTTGRSLA